MTISRVSDGTVLSASPDVVWKIIRSFDSVARWDPFARDCVIEAGWPADRVGAVRQIHLQDGTPMRERLTAISDKDMTFSFSVIESPMSFAYHSSTVRLLPIDRGGRTILTWDVEFSLTDGDPAALVTAIHEGLIIQGFQGLAKLVADGGR
jgi:hypothetical protein